MRLLLLNLDPSVLPFDSSNAFLQGKLYLLLLGTTALSLVRTQSLHFYFVSDIVLSLSMVDIKYVVESQTRRWSLSLPSLPLMTLRCDELCMVNLLPFVQLCR